MREQQDDKLYKVIETLRNCTVYNLSLLTHSTAKDINGLIQHPRKIVYKLVHQGRVKPIDNYPQSRHNKQYAYNTFYTPVGAKSKQISIREIEHESAIRDVLIGLLKAYPDYSLKVQYEPIYKLEEDTYKPDAYIEMTNIKGKFFSFILEMERTRGVSEIVNDKIKKKMLALDFKRNKLPSRTQFIVAHTHEKFNVYTRPIEYPEIKEQLKSLDLLTKELATRDLPYHKFRFLPFHDYHRLEEAVLYDPLGNKVKLINE